MAHDLIDPIKVRKEMDVMIDMITHPEFVDAMKTMKETPVSGRRDIGKKILTVDALIAKGVPIPPKMRLTTRYFEAGKPGILEFTPDGKITQTTAARYIKNTRGELEWGGCACGGGMSFCGGAGGGT